MDNPFGSNVPSIPPLDIKTRRVILNNGQMYEALTYEEYAKLPQELLDSSHIGVIVTDKNDINKEICLPYRGEYSGRPINPGIYSAGCIDFEVLPNEATKIDYIPKGDIQISSNESMEEVLEKQKEYRQIGNSMLINDTDNVTRFEIAENDQPAMRLLKMALNQKAINIDDYAGRFGDNFPNDKRQLKNNNVTLNILSRFCDKCDMELLLTIQDANSDVPNPMGTPITLSITDAYRGEDNN